VVAWPDSDPTLDLGVLVGAEVVDDEMDIEPRRHVDIDVLEKAEELLVPVAWLALTKDMAARHIEGSEEGRRAVADVAIRNAFDVAKPEGEQRSRAPWRLGLALLIDAQHHRMVGRIEISADDVADLFDEE
jgi:hypothetical protein